MFGIFDNRGDGKVQVSQLGELLRACGQNPTEGEWRKLVGDDTGLSKCSSHNQLRLFWFSISLAPMTFNHRPFSLYDYIIWPMFVTCMIVREGIEKKLSALRNALYKSSCLLSHVWFLI